MLIPQNEGDAILEEIERLQRADAEIRGLCENPNPEDGEEDS